MFTDVQFDQVLTCASQLRACAPLHWFSGPYQVPDSIHCLWSPKQLALPGNRLGRILTLFSCHKSLRGRMLLARDELPGHWPGWWRWRPQLPSLCDLLFWSYTIIYSSFVAFAKKSSICSALLSVKCTVSADIRLADHGRLLIHWVSRLIVFYFLLSS